MMRRICRTLLATFYGIAGCAHLARPDPFLMITPDWVPAPASIIWLTGVAEIAGAVALLQDWSPNLRKVAGVMLALYALCVWPANFNHMAMDLARSDGGLGLGYHIPRLIAQPLLIWLALWTGDVIEDPKAVP